MKTLHSTRKQDFMYQLEPVVAFSQLYLDYPRLADFSLIELVDDPGFRPDKDAPYGIIRVFISQPLAISGQKIESRRQNFILSFSLFGNTPVIDLVSYPANRENLIRRHMVLLDKNCQLGTGRLIVRPDATIGFMGSSAYDNLAAYLIDAVGFKTDGNVIAGAEEMTEILSND